MGKEDVKKIKAQIASYEDRIERAQAMAIKREHIDLLRARVEGLKNALKRAEG